MLGTHQTIPPTSTRDSQTNIEPEERGSGKAGTSSWIRRVGRALRRYPIPLSALLLLPFSLVFWLTGHAALAQTTLLGLVLMGGIPLAWEMLTQFWHREFSVDVIAILAIIGSLLLQQYLAGAFIVLMLSGGEALEAFALRRARVSLSALVERAPRKAHLWQGDQLLDVAAEVVEVGMQIVVKPGELIPVDGLVSSGSSNVSEADLTGEPVPVRKLVGMVVLSGSVNLDGVLEVRASARSAESHYAQIIRLVEEAQQQKAPIHRLADRYSLWFTAIAILFAAIAWLISRDSVYALAVLVVATPCPLILATPIAIMSGIDVAARHGIIIKSGGAIEQLGEVDIVAFDKTGTLTLGTPRVTEMITETTPIQPSPGQEEPHQQNTDERQSEKERWLGLAASVEQLSNHILARAVVSAARERGVGLSLVSDFEELFGKGVHGRIEGTGEMQEETSGQRNLVDIAVGNRTCMRHFNIALPDTLLAERERHTVQGQQCSFLAVDGRVVGLIVLEDVPRADLKQLTSALKKQGIKQTILLTGDSEVVAQQIGHMAQMDRVVARCLPEEKVQMIQQLIDQKHQVLMVGDGVNDAPALATATVGMALGSQGLTAAANAADAVLLSTDLLRVVDAVRLGRIVMRVALQGIWIGMGLSIVAMFFAALGFISPAAGAILQEGIDVLVILNALRVGRVRI